MNTSAASPIRKSKLIAVFFLRARIIQRALDLASAVTTHLSANGLAPWTFNVLLGTGVLHFGACPGLMNSGAGTVVEGGASPLNSARLSRAPSLILPYTYVTYVWGREGWGTTNRHE
jgi:hypothetical protein